MKKLSSALFFFFLLFYSFSFGQSSLTDLLTKQFHQAWNNENINEMISLLQANAFFQSSNELYYGREKMKDTLLKKNPKKYKFAATREIHSYAEDRLAWSIGEYTCDVYDEYGYKTGEHVNGTYTYVFSKRNKGDWKVQMLIYHEQ